MRAVTNRTWATHDPRDCYSDREVPFWVSCGLGVDSVALLVGLKARGIRPDAIIFADVGAEKPETYLYMPILRDWCRRNDFPDPVVVRLVPPRATYRTITENMLANDTMPGEAFNVKSCTPRWKIDPIHDWLESWEPVKRAHAAGKRPRGAIGFDATEGKRVSRGWKRSGEDPKWNFWYPLMEWGWNRDRCKAEIKKAGLPVPVKSACFFCPNTTTGEIVELSLTNLPMLRKALEIEDGYRDGKHFKGDDVYRVRLKERATGEKAEPLELRAASLKEARAKANRLVGDEYRVTGVSPAVRGLARTKTWREILDREKDRYPLFEAA